jgi:hypothetical protein
MSEMGVILLGVKSPARLLERITADLTDEQLHWNPPGTAHSVAATWAHAIVSTDWQIRSLFEGQEPMYATAWAGKTGVSDVTPAQTLEWAQSVRVNAPELREYASAVYDALFAYVEAKSEEDLDRPVDVSIIGAGDRPLRWCLVVLIVGHLNQLAGEIAAVKGMQGLVGY